MFSYQGQNRELALGKQLVAKHAIYLLQLYTFYEKHDCKVSSNQSKKHADEKSFAV